MDTARQRQYAETFHGLHRTGDPLVLFNAWDVACAKAIATASPAVATSSAAVAAALGYEDGESVPLNILAGLVSRMTALFGSRYQSISRQAMATRRRPPRCP